MKIGLLLILAVCALLALVLVAVVIVLKKKMYDGPKHNKLVIVAIFKNEALCMKEWLTHYANQGVDHFYLIDNGSTDNWSELTDGFPVTVYTDNRPQRQVQHYNNYFLDTVKKEAEWVMVVDLDEFMYARKGFRTIPEYLQSLPAIIGQVSVQWLMFGSNGHKQQPSSIIQGFTKRFNYNNNSQKFYYHKSICRTKNLVSFHVHEHSHRQQKIRLDVKSEAAAEAAPLHLNHYAIQSLDFFEKIKMRRGDAYYPDSQDSHKNYEYFKERDINEIEDIELARATR